MKSHRGDKSSLKYTEYARISPFLSKGGCHDKAMKRVATTAAVTLRGSDGASL